MTDTELLEGKKILAVDDEEDILESLKELLPMCELDVAKTHEEAWQALGTHYYDVAILDIMGVDGYRLLELANDRGISAIMLTAHAISPENVKKSFHGGAALYLPKDEMIHIASHICDVIKAKAEGRNTWSNWLNRLGTYFSNLFGPGWEKKHDVFPDSFFDRYQ
jgi:CheY-like chemotaxis protein